MWRGSCEGDAEAILKRMKKLSRDIWEKAQKDAASRRAKRWPVQAATLITKWSDVLGEEAQSTNERTEWSKEVFRALIPGAARSGARTEWITHVRNQLRDWKAPEEARGDIANTSQGGRHRMLPPQPVERPRSEKPQSKGEQTKSQQQGTARLQPPRQEEGRLPESPAEGSRLGETQSGEQNTMVHQKGQGERRQHLSAAVLAAV